MFAIIRIAFKDLLRRWMLGLVMALLFSITFASYIALVSYQKSLSSTYFSLNSNWLVVQESFGSGEVHGSRLTSEIGQILIDNGYSPIPEIHQVVGTSLANGIMLRGVNPEDLFKVSPYKLLDGRNLAAGDSPRLAMVGVSLASRQNIKVGDNIKLRGRDFTTIGIFKTGSYEDSQAWVSLSDAQKLINYGTDVSIYFIRDDGILPEGYNLAEGVSLGRRGDSGNTFGKEAMTFFNYLGLVAIFVGIATMITLTNLLWRIAWLHRREFGILRTLGFGRYSVILYLLVQSGIILFLGGLVGGVSAVTIVIARIQDFSAFGIGLSPVWDLYTIGIIAIITIMIAGIGIVLPASAINRMTTPELLGRD